MFDAVRLTFINGILLFFANNRQIERETKAKLLY